MEAEQVTTDCLVIDYIFHFAANDAASPISPMAYRVSPWPFSTPKTPYAMPVNTTFQNRIPSSVVPVLYFSGASGSLSMTYFPLATLIIGTPGIFLTARC